MKTLFLCNLKAINTMELKTLYTFTKFDDRS